MSAPEIPEEVRERALRTIALELLTSSELVKRAIDLVYLQGYLAGMKAMKQTTDTALRESLIRQLQGDMK